MHLQGIEGYREMPAILGAERDDGDHGGGHAAHARGQRALGGGGLALWDAAKVGGGPLGRWLRPPRAGHVVRAAADRGRRHPGHGARGQRCCWR
jgi:hypothetical protein